MMTISHNWKHGLRKTGAILWLKYLRHMYDSDGGVGGGGGGREECKVPYRNVLSKSNFSPFLLIADVLSFQNIYIY